MIAAFSTCHFSHGHSFFSSGDDFEECVPCFLQPQPSLAKTFIEPDFSPISL